MARRLAPRKPKPAIAPPSPEWVGARIERPPSASRLFRIERGKRTATPTSAFSAWRDFGLSAFTRAVEARPVSGPYEVLVYLGPKKGARLAQYIDAFDEWLANTSRRSLAHLPHVLLCAGVSVRWHEGLNAREAAVFVRPVPQFAALDISEDAKALPILAGALHVAA